MNIRSIGFKLVAGGVISVALPLIIVGILATSKASTSLQTLSMNNARETAADIAGMVKVTLEEEKKIAAAFASGRGIRETGAAVKANGVEGAAAEIAVLRQEMKAKYSRLDDHYLGIFVTTPDGILYTGELASGKEYKGSDVSKRDYFQEAKKTGQVVVGDVVRSKSTGKLICVICAPVLSDSGEFLGAFGMSMKASRLTDLVTRKKIGETGYAFMVNKKGVVIAHPSDKHILSLDLRTLKGMEEITEKMLGGQSGVESYRFNDIDKIAGFAPVEITGWSIGATQNQSEFLTSSRSIRNWLVGITAVALALTIVGVLFSARSITGPINSAVAGLKDIAQGEGDLTMRLDVRSKDEIGELARWFNTFIEKLQGIIGQISNNTGQLGSSSETLLNIASAMSRSASETSGRALSVTTATEEMSANLNAVAAAMEESSTNSNMVATAAEEMSATINEIAQNSENARRISESAVSQAERASGKMGELGIAANDIGKVTETITEISEQTNLLALNATIEAARAGEAGKGFAVVANEIKELAKQTSQATQNIKQKIHGIQSTTDTTVTEIEEISKVIRQVNDIVATIASAVEEQSTATREIANNIAQASQGIQEVNENVTQSSTVSSEIARDIADVNASAEEMSGNSSQVNDNAAQLKRLSGQLQAIVDTFKI